jgi:hypothetical protein
MMIICFCLKLLRIHSIIFIKNCCCCCCRRREYIYLWPDFDPLFIPDDLDDEGLDDEGGNPVGAPPPAVAAE